LVVFVCLFVCLLFWDRVLLCIPDWSRIYCSPKSASLVLGLQCTPPCLSMVFSHSVGCLFTSLIVFFALQMFFFIWCNSFCQILLLFLELLLFDVLSRNHCLCQYLEVFLLVFL
jgi:hypothetical protein